MSLTPTQRAEQDIINSVGSKFFYEQSEERQKEILEKLKSLSYYSKVANLYLQDFAELLDLKIRKIFRIKK